MNLYIVSEFFKYVLKGHFSVAMPVGGGPLVLAGVPCSLHTYTDSTFDLHDLHQASAQHPVRLWEWFSPLAGPTWSCVWHFLEYSGILIP